MRTIALCVCLLLLIGAPPLALVYALIAPTVTGTLEGIERATIAHDLRVAGRLLDVQDRQVSKEANDYGQWTAMQTAMLHHDLPWLRANLDRSVLTDYELASVLVLDARNRVVYALGRPLAIANLPSATFRATHGATMFGDVPLPALIGSAPIEGNTGQPPRVGTVVFVRPIDGTLLGEIGASTNHSVALLGPSGSVVARGPGLPEGIPWGRVAAAGAGIRVQGAWGFGGWPMAQAGGRPGATMVVVESRSVILRAEEEMRVRTLLALGVLLGLATLGGTVLSLWLLRGLSRLKLAMMASTVEGAHTRILPPRQGIFGEVLQNFQAVLATLETALRAQRELALRADEIAAQAREVERMRGVERLRADFIASTSHELRTPLTVMRGYVDVLEAHWGDLEDAGRREMLGKAASGLVRLERLVADLLLVSRLEAGMLHLQAAPVDVQGLVKEVAAELSAAYAGQVITVETTPVPWVIGDRGRIRQIITNLVDNAVKYSPVGVGVELRIGEQHGAVAVAVVDHGPGLGPAAVERLFLRFGTAGSTPRPGAMATGLGLYICKALAQAMSSRIELESTPGVGSTFTLLLARYPVAQSSHGDARLNGLSPVACDRSVYDRAGLADKAASLPRSSQAARRTAVSALAAPLDEGTTNAGTAANSAPA